MTVLPAAAVVSIAEWTNRTFGLPVLVFFPTSRCNSRCVSCEWWNSDGEADLSLAEIASLTAQLPALGTRTVLLSGGEPLLRPEVFDIAALFRLAGADLHLHTSGVLLNRHVEAVAAAFSRVIVSLDSASEEGYRAIRGVAALPVVEQGVARLRARRPDLPITARSTLHAMNYRELPQLIEHARAMALDGISFLAADLSSSAFGRRAAGGRPGLGLSPADVAEFSELVERVIVEHAGDFASGFVLESPEKLRRLPQHYAALAGLAPHPPVSCNAPYMSVVVEADGMVRPCFFHDPVGSIRTHSLREILAGPLPAFRAGLWMEDDPVCRRCVCSMRTGWRNAPWR